MGTFFTKVSTLSTYAINMGWPRFVGLAGLAGIVGWAASGRRPQLRDLSPTPGADGSKDTFVATPEKDGKHSAATQSSPSMTTPSSAEKFNLERLRTDKAAQRRLCESMSSVGHCVITAPRSTARAIGAVTKLTGRFFDKPLEEKKGLGNVRYARGKLVGYLQRDDGAQFLEVHGTSNGFVIPEPESMKTFGPACGRLHEELLTIGREVLSWMAEYIRVPPEALLSCLDTPSLQELDQDDFGACVLRLCNYQLCASEEVFAEHSDASFLTVAPRSSAPGLQMWHAPTLAWQDVEHGLDTSDIVVFVGDFVEMLTKGFYKAALHRVVLRPEDATNRVSMPFLIRGQPSAHFHTAPYVDADPDVLLKRLADTPYEDVRLFLDLKGMKRMQNRTMAAATGVAPLPDSVLAPSGVGSLS